jgi:hypothetical protein
MAAGAIGSATYQFVTNVESGRGLLEGVSQAAASGARDGAAAVVGAAVAGRFFGAIGRVASGADGAASSVVPWRLGAFKSTAKWESQMKQRGWTTTQVTEAVARGEQFTAENLVNRGNGATRYVHPSTGRSVVLDNRTREVIHVGGDGFKYE